MSFINKIMDAFKMESTREMAKVKILCHFLHFVIYSIHRLWQAEYIGKEKIYAYIQF